MIYSVQCTEAKSSEGMFRKYLSSKVESAASKAERESNELWIIKHCFQSWKGAVWIIKHCFQSWKEAVEKSKLAPGSGMESACKPEEWLKEGLNLAQAIYLSVLFTSFQKHLSLGRGRTYVLKHFFWVCRYLTMMASCMVCREAIQFVLFNMSPHGTIL